MGNRLGIDGGATMNWFVPDPHGNVAASLSADEVTVTNATRYDAWGETVTTGTEGGTAVGAVHFKYQGRLDISNPAIEPLYDMSARFYSPNLGAFTQLDSYMGSAQNPLSMSRYLYAHANPATLIDPTGHVAEENDGPSQSVTQKINASEYLQRKFADETQRFVSYKAKAKQGGTKRVQAYQAKQRAIKAKIAAKVAVRKVEADYVDMTGREAKPDRGGLHTVLDFAGMIPVVGIVADVANSGLYAMEGDYLNAGMSAIGAIPLLGDGLAAGRMAIRYGDDAVSALAHAGDEVAGAGSGGLNIVGKAGTTCKNSFAAGTPVAVSEDQSVPIEELRVGDSVQAFSEATGEVETHVVTTVIIGHDGATGTVEIDGEPIATTPGHPFFTVERGWVEAADLRSGDHVELADNGVGLVGQISWARGPATMYNLTVETVHTYFVGVGEWLVHNDGCEELYAFGNAAGPRAPRIGPGAGDDIAPGADGLLSPQSMPNPAGASLTGDPVGSGLSGVYHGIPTNADLPPGTAIGHTPRLDDPTHHTFFPTRAMTPQSFTDAWSSLPWQRRGKL